MSNVRDINFGAIRSSMASFDQSARVEPNETISLDRAFFPDGHRGVLDLKRPLVVGNRGMGKSFWTHALLNEEFRKRLAKSHGLSALGKTQVVIGFNGSDKRNPVAPSTDEIATALKSGAEPDLIWRAVLLRGARSTKAKKNSTFNETLRETLAKPNLYPEAMSELDDRLANDGNSLIIVFDALDRLARDWGGIHNLTKSLLTRIAGLQSFRSIRAKIFMRVDQFADTNLFHFPDSSKIKNGHVDLKWLPHELYALLLFELMRSPKAAEQLEMLAQQNNAAHALPRDGRMHALAGDQLSEMVTALAGDFMGTNKKRGRVLTWVPLHLSDAANNCSPRTFLRAWRAAAEHRPQPTDKVVDHLGLIDGVRKASTDRLEELREDYAWIDPALKALTGQLVPISREELFNQWTQERVIQQIQKNSASEPTRAPVGFAQEANLPTLLDAMKNIAVMEERTNGKINVPDIFRVEAGIKRKGGVAVPRRG